MKKLIFITLLIIGCDNSTEPKDCAGVADGDSVEDCFGVCGGTASIDDCGVCTGGTTNLEINYLKDDCEICGGDNSSCVDCLGIANGNASLDNCGTCDSYPLNDCTNYIEMNLEILPSSLYYISDWINGTTNLAKLTIENNSNETKEFSLIYSGKINNQIVVTGQTKSISLASGLTKSITSSNFDPYSILWYENDEGFIYNLNTIGYLLSGNYSIEIYAKTCDSEWVCQYYNPQFWDIPIGYASTDSLYQTP